MAGFQDSLLVGTSAAPPRACQGRASELGPALHPRLSLGWPHPRPHSRQPLFILFPWLSHFPGEAWALGLY